MSRLIKRILLFILAVFVLSVVISTLDARPVPDHPFFQQFDRYPLVIAHAGSTLFPTDTIFALEQYADMGVDILEMDVHMTRDGAIVLIHDDTVDRTTDGTGDIRAMSLAEAQSLDAGYYWTQDDGGTYPYRGKGIVIPPLETVFETFPGYPMIIEIKQETTSMAQPLCSLIREHGMAEKVIIPSFSDVATQEFRRACPEVATAASTGEVTNFVIRNFILLSGTISPDYYAMQVPESRSGIPVVTRLFLWAAQRRNIQVHIWTINEREDMQRFIEMGVDGIMTDRADLLFDLLE
ncbi:MAG: glycerophosphodiester phosphodiesterase [Anaerolineaceae bacterium]|nr:glycerophosphodiester phosphodiesterase [Anaerolineaceae bacterium]